jgi:hypothetical protein
MHTLSAPFKYAAIHPKKFFPRDCHNFSLYVFPYLFFGMGGESFCRLCPSILLTGTCDYKALTTVTMYGLSLKGFVAVAAHNFKMQVSCARHLRDFCGVF